MSDITLKDRLKDAEAEARKEAKKKCEERKGHRWSPPFGRRVSGGGKPMLGGFGCDGEEVQYTEEWSHYQRDCVDCGEVETSDMCGAEWRYDAKQGWFECCPRTGKLIWVDKDGNKKEFSEFMGFI